MADFNTVWLNQPRSTPLPIHVTQNTTVEQFLGLQTSKPDYQLLQQQFEPMNQVINPVFSIICDRSYDRCRNKGYYLEKRIHSLQFYFPSEIEVLSNEYHDTVFDLEMKNLTAVMDTSQEQHVRINRYFNHQRQMLIHRIDRKLDSLEKSHRITVTHQRKPKNFTILRHWFSMHAEYPYPTLNQIKMLSNMGDLEIKDAKLWFAHERIRHKSAAIRKMVHLF